MIMVGAAFRSGKRDSGATLAVLTLAAEAG
jgi:hypothetical protein